MKDQVREIKKYVPEIDLNKAKIFTVVHQAEVAPQNHDQSIRRISDLTRDGNDRLQEHVTQGILLLGERSWQEYTCPLTKQ